MNKILSIFICFISLSSIYGQRTDKHVVDSIMRHDIALDSASIDLLYKDDKLAIGMLELLRSDTTGFFTSMAPLLFESLIKDKTDRKTVSKPEDKSVIPKPIIVQNYIPFVMSGVDSMIHRIHSRLTNRDEILLNKDSSDYDNYTVKFIVRYENDTIRTIQRFSKNFGHVSDMTVTLNNGVIERFSTFFDREPGATYTHRKSVNEPWKSKLPPVMMRYKDTGEPIYLVGDPLVVRDKNNLPNSRLVDSIEHAASQKWLQSRYFFSARGDTTRTEHIFRTDYGYREHVFMDLRIPLLRDNKYTHDGYPLEWAGKKYFYAPLDERNNWTYMYGGHGTHSRKIYYRE